jgi:hypothetical protein
VPLAQSTFLAAGGCPGLRLFRSESFHACVHETVWNKSRRMATPQPGTPLDIGGRYMFVPLGRVDSNQNLTKRQVRFTKQP